MVTGKQVSQSRSQPSIEELSAVELAVVKAKQSLAGVEHTRLAALAKVEREIDEYTQRKTVEAQKELVKLTQSIDDLSQQYDRLTKEMDEAKVEYAELHNAQSAEYARVERELDEMKREHAGLAEAMNKAAAMFSHR